VIIMKLESWCMRIRLYTNMNEPISMDTLKEYLRKYNGIIVFDDRDKYSLGYTRIRFTLHYGRNYSGEPIMRMTYNSTDESYRDYTIIVRYIRGSYNLFIAYKDIIHLLANKVAGIIYNVFNENKNVDDVDELVGILSEKLGKLVDNKMVLTAIAVSMIDRKEAEIYVPVKRGVYWYIDDAVLLHSFNLDTPDVIHSDVLEIIETHKLYLENPRSILYRPM